MDFSKFRESGDLSDLVVVVEGVENHLHRFPLYAKSDYFCELAREPQGLGQSHFTSPSKVRVELEEFPGGQAAFSLVADFCYSMAPQITRDNVIPLCCAAHFLKMTGPANLQENADKFLQDVVSSAKVSRSCSSLVALLLHCAGVGVMAAECGAVDALTSALVDTWLRSPGKTPQSGTAPGPHSASAFSLQTSSASAFTPMKPAASSSTPFISEDAQDEETIKSLCLLPHDWFSSLLTKALDRGVQPSHLADMAVRYVSLNLNKDGAGESSSSNTATMNLNSSPNGRPAGNNSTCSTPVGDPVMQLAGDTAHKDADDSDKDVDSVTEGVQGVPVFPRGAVDVANLLDNVLTTLPEEAYTSLPSVTLPWLTKVLRVATARGCSCRQLLVRLAADKLKHLPAEDLCLVSPSVLHDIVQEAQADESQLEHASGLVDSYLTQMASKGVLTSDTLRLLVTAVPPKAWRSHDNLYRVLEHVLKAEDTLSKEESDNLLSILNLDLVNEDTLRSALNSDLLTPDLVARAALKLCSSLRSELESVKLIAQMQEAELNKNHAPSPASSPRLALLPASARIDSDSGYSDLGLERKSSQDAANDHVRAAQNVLSSARSKLAMPLYPGHRSYLHSSTLPHLSSLPGYHGSLGLEHDITLQEELEYRLDRASFRSLEPRARSSRHLHSYSESGSGSGSGSGSSSHHHHRSTYFPYSPRY